MGSKIVQVGLIIAGVVIIIIFITAIMPVFVDFTSTANTTIAASSNFSDYPGTQSALLAAPLWIYFIPVIVGVVAIVMVLREKR